MHRSWVSSCGSSCAGSPSTRAGVDRGSRQARRLPLPVPPRSTPPGRTRPSTGSTARRRRRARRSSSGRASDFDPYRTGLPVPHLLLALLEMHPELLGSTPAALGRPLLASRGGARPPRASRIATSARPACQAWAFTLTDDPNTRVLFVVHSCALCLSGSSGGPAARSSSSASATPPHPRARSSRRRSQSGRRRASTSRREPVAAAIAARIAAERFDPWLRRVAEHHRQHHHPGRKGPLHGSASAAARARRRRSARAWVATIGVVRGGPGSSSFHRDVETKSKTNRLGEDPRQRSASPRKRTLSWDGGSEGLERADVLVVDADIAAGARVEWHLQAPAAGREPLDVSAPLAAGSALLPGAIDAGLAARGKPVFERACAKCHGTYEEDGRAKSYVEKVVPLDYVDTDPARAMAVTDEFLAAAIDVRLVLGGMRLVTTRRTAGYVPPVLTNIWARAPYGHAGQWPSLAALAAKPALRPVRFVVHGEAPLDLDKVGVSTADPGASSRPGRLPARWKRRRLSRHGAPVHRRSRRRVEGRRRVPEDALNVHPHRAGAACSRLHGGVQRAAWPSCRRLAHHATWTRHPRASRSATRSRTAMATGAGDVTKNCRR